MSVVSNRLLALLVLGAVGSSGCVDERAFFIVENKSPCVSSLSLASGVLDVAGKQGYVVEPVVQNDLLSSAGTDQQPERNRLQLDKFKVSLDLGQAAAANVPDSLVNFEYPTSGTISPGSTLQAKVRVVPDALVGYLNFPSGHRPLIIATIQAVALHNGSTIESTESHFPIELCSGCLVRDLGACPTEAVEYSSNECGLPQDQPVVCCTDSVAGFHCLKTSELPTGTGTTP